MATFNEFKRILSLFPKLNSLTLFAFYVSISDNDRIDIKSLVPNLMCYVDRHYCNHLLTNQVISQHGVQLQCLQLDHPKDIVIPSNVTFPNLEEIY